MSNNLKILATAYAVNPYKGSEDGMGWNFILQIARFNNVIAVTRENNRPHIEKFMRENPSQLYNQIKFLYFDLPYWMRFWKKGGRGALLYFWLWQRAMPTFIRKQGLSFDIVHNVNFHNDWTPSYLWKLKKPFVWGPIGHHPQIPYAYLRKYSFSHLAKEILTTLAKKLFWFGSPALRNTIKHANYIWCMNSDVERVINLSNKPHGVMPSVATEDFGLRHLSKSEKFTVLSVGRLVALKGFDLSISSFADFVKRLPLKDRAYCELIIVGSGPEEKKLSTLAQDLGVDPYVHFISWIDRKDLLDIYRQASAFLFPSHEGAGMVVAEALSFGLPVICLNNAGPGEFVDNNSGLVIKQGDFQETVVELSQAMTRLYRDSNFLLTMSKGARQRFEDRFHWDVRGEQLKQIYKQVAA
jgi:glycosyltransferase involved in cell wall biosynthesis